MQLVDSQAALQSEKVILEMVLLDNEQFYQLDRIQPDDFQNGDHRQIFVALRERVQAGDQVDHVTLHQLFESAGKSHIANLVIDLDRGFVGNQKIESHVQEVLRASHRRQIIKTLEAAVAQARDFSEDNESVLAVTYDRLLDIQDFGRSSKSLRVSDFSDAFYARVERIANQQAGVGGFTTGIAALDEMTTGFRLGEYIIVGAYTGEGKSSYVIQVIAENCRAGVKVLLFSQEMSKDAVLARVIPQVADIPAWKLRNPRKMVGSDRAVFAESKAIVDGFNLWVNDASTLHASELVSHAHTMVRKHGIKLIVVDYIQLMKAEGDKRYDQVSAASGALRELAKSQNVVVIAVSQLARPEGKIKRAPTMFDLKASGELENDAHLILFPWRPVDKQGYTAKDFIIIGKQREGPVGRVPVVFDRERLMFNSRQEEGSQEPLESEWYK